MRTRAVLFFLTFGLGASVAAGGCQVIAGLSSLTVTTGTGGATSSTGSAGSSGSGGGDAGRDGDSGDSGPNTPPCTPGTPCGGNCAGNTLLGGAVCDETGSCPATGTLCESSGQKGVCVQPPAAGTGGATPGTCAPCGVFPGMSTSTCPMGCADCEQDSGVCVTPCNAGVCLTGCPQAGCTGSSVTIDATQSSARYDCTGPAGCNGLDIQCNGPFPCTVACNGGCVGLHLTCDPLGPCTLACGSKSCMDATVTCGHNTCAVTCTEKGPASMDCGDSCACSSQPQCPSP